MSYTYAGQYGAQQVINATGVPQPSTPVTVYLHNTNTPATLYTDRTKATVGPNPVSTDALGNLTFYANPGTYDLAVSGMSNRVSVLVPDDPQEVQTGATVQTQIVTSSGSVVAPSWATYAEVIAVGAGGGGGGAGSALTAGGVNGQMGGSGGAAGMQSHDIVHVIGGTSYPVSIGAGGVGGAGGAVNGNGGTLGSGGGHTTALGVYAEGGGGGGASGANTNSTAGINGGMYGMPVNGGNLGGQLLYLGFGQVPGTFGGPPGMTRFGGASGASATALLGGVGGGTLSKGNQATATGNTASVNGGAGTNDGGPGSGGGGGGGGAPGGTGGNGGNGAPGVVYITWRAQ